MILESVDRLGLEARRAMGEFLSGFAWDHYVTLTSRFRISPEALQREIEGKFVRSLSRKSQRALAYFFAIERDVGIGPCHAHGLVAGTFDLAVRSIQRSWGRGHTRIVRYDAERGAASYIVKALPTNFDYFFLSTRMPNRLLADESRSVLIGA